MLGLMEQNAVRPLHRILDGTLFDMDLRASSPRCRLTGRVGAVSGNGTWNGAGRTFDGAGDRVNIADEAALRFGTGDFQIHIWCTHGTQVNDNGYFFTKGGTSDGAFVLRLDSSGTPGRIEVVGDGTTLSCNSSSDIYENDGIMHLFSLIRHGNEAKLYVDGVYSGIDSDVSGVDLDGAFDFAVGTITNYDATYTWVGTVVRLVVANATKTFAQAEADMAALFALGPYGN
ncbi:MAG: hypothetical protein JXL80_17530 [Planctomycetes bacterium]|nr:hypothetical protein [Planctomycetota bacterium]